MKLKYLPFAFSLLLSATYPAYADQNADLCRDMLVAQYPGDEQMEAGHSYQEVLTFYEGFKGPYRIAYSNGLSDVLFRARVTVKKLFSVRPPGEPVKIEHTDISYVIDCYPIGRELHFLSEREAREVKRVGE